jgi:hypothetical protein
MFNLMTDHIVCVQSPNWSEATLDQTVKELLAEAEQHGSVVAAKNKLDEANAKVEKFKARQCALNERAIVLRKSLDASLDRLSRAMLADAEFEDRAFMEQGRIETEYKGCGSALQLCVSEILPGANADLLSAHCDHWHALAKAIKAVATQRVEAIIKKMAVIADEDCMIEFNAWKIPTISALLSKHSQLFERDRQGRESLATIRENLSTKKG